MEKMYSVVITEVILSHSDSIINQTLRIKKRLRTIGLRILLSRSLIEKLKIYAWILMKWRLKT